MSRRRNNGPSTILGQILGAALTHATSNPHAEDYDEDDDGDEYEDDDDDDDDDDDEDDDDLAEAHDEYEAFHWGNQPDSVVEVKLPDPPRTLVKIGDLEGVIYRTAKGTRKQDSWVHMHDKRARPVLAYDPKTGQLYIIGGKYKITPRGIED